MIEFLTKSSLFLGFFLCCYLLFFKNDKRFTFNRFYLLITLTFSLIAPFISFSWIFDSQEIDVSHLYFTEETRALVQSIPGSFEIEDISDGHDFNWVYYVFCLLYATGVLLMSFRFIKNLLSLKKHIKKAEKVQYKDIQLLLVPERVTPFCFGKYIFLNKEDHSNGKIDHDIISHENVHASHYHTLDILLIEFMLVFYWFNPLIWVYRDLLKANHEFSADDHVVKNKSELEQYCNKIIDFIKLPNHPSFTSNVFNYKLTKNRILMMNRTKPTTLSFYSRLIIALSLFTLLITAFSFKDHTSISPYISNSKKFTVIIDAGHGGNDHGAVSAHTDVQEKDLVLEICKAIEQQHSNSAIDLIFTRNSDQNISLMDRARLSENHGADLFLSLHINHHENNQLKGIEVFYSTLNSKSNLAKNYSEIFANNIRIASAKPSSVNTGNFVVLKEPKCPSLLLNLGYISNQEDLNYLLSKENQKAIAIQIVNTINQISKL